MRVLITSPITDWRFVETLHAPEAYRVTRGRLRCLPEYGNWVSDLQWIDGAYQTTHGVSVKLVRNIGALDRAIAKKVAELEGLVALRGAG